MQQDIIVSLPLTHLFLPIVSLILLAVAVIVGLDCVWRVEKRLDIFLKLITAALVLRIVYEVMVLLAPTLEMANTLINIFSAFLFLLGMAEMYKIIKTWDNENPPKTPSIPQEKDPSN